MNLRELTPHHTPRGARVLHGKYIISRRPEKVNISEVMSK